MKNALFPVTIVVVLCAGYTLSWLKAEQPTKGSSRLSSTEINASDAALRHKKYQPMHWRSLVLQQHN